MLNNNNNLYTPKCLREAGARFLAIQDAEQRAIADRKATRRATRSEFSLVCVDFDRLPDVIQDFPQ